MASNQLIRQWTLLQELAGSYRGKTMEELGRLLEVGKRTARRDLESLEAAGFPVEKYRDGREVRYRLLRGEVKERLVDPYCLRIHQATFVVLTGAGWD